MLMSILADLPRPIGRIVHIGTGASGILPDYLDLEVASVLLVEPDSGTAAELASRAMRDARVEVIHAVVSSETRPRPYYVTNLPELDSLYAPDRLRDLFPGLRVLSTETVAPICPADLLQGRPAPEEGTQLLVLDTPGEVLGILQALDRAELLLPFGAICLREWQTPLHEGLPVIGQIRDWLENAGYIATPEPVPGDPDRPWLSARIDDPARKQRDRVKRLQARIETAQDRADVLLRERNALRATAGARQAELKAAQDRIAELTKERNTIRKTAEARQTELKAAQDRIVDLTKERNEIRKTAGTRQKNLDAAQDRIAELTKERDQLSVNTEARLQKGRDEILKADGQIRLLRDMLLNGPEA